MITELLDVVGSGSSLLLVLVVFGFAPGFCLRLIVLAYPRGDPRRAELIAELYAVPRIQRPLWVAEQLEVALFEGLPHRWAAFLRWLARHRARPQANKRNGPLMGLGEGLLDGLVVGLGTGTLYGNARGLTVGLMVGLGAGLTAGIAAWFGSRLAFESATWFGSRLVVGIAAGLPIGIEAGLEGGLLSGFGVGLLCGIPFGFGGMMRGRWRPHTTRKLRDQV